MDEPQDTHVQIEGDGNVAGDGSSAQVIKVEGGSTAIGVTQVAGDFYAAPPTPAPATPPAPPAHFVGREGELAALARALTTGDTPQAITALQGMGGIGKTALAAQLAAQLDGAFPGGVFWADLPASGGDPLPILAAWARLCGHEVSALPDPRARAQTVRGCLAGRVAKRGRLLVVLDDVRQGWLDGARVLQAARPPGVPALLTTRDEELALALGATVRRLDVLPLPRALELLATLAGPVVEREPEAARRLAQRVGCLPLALELAGKLAALHAHKPGWRLADLCAQVEARAAEALRLKGQPGLVACFSLSYDQLAADEQRLFRALGVFAPAPFAAEHVAAVLDWEVAATEAGLDALVALALARWAEGEPHRPEAPVLAHPPAPPVDGGAADGGATVRYTLHPLLRDYAAALLEETGEGPAARAAHTAHYLAYAWAHRQPTAADYDALEAERPHLLAAMDRAYREEQWTQVRRFAWALGAAGGYLYVRGYWDELRARLEQAVHAAEAEGHRRDAAALAGNLAALLYQTGDLEAAGREYRRVLAIFEELDERESVATIYHQLGMLAQATGDYAQARDLYQRSLDIAEELGDRAGVARTLHQLGRLAQAEGDYAQARGLYQRSLDINEELGNRAGVAITLHELGRLAQATGDYAQARGLLYQRSLDIAEELGDRAGVASTLHELGRLAQAEGDYAQARDLSQRSLDINEELGNQAGVANTLGQLGVLAKAEGDPAEAERLYWRVIDVCKELGDVVTESIALFNLALLCEAQGRLAEALPLLERAVEVFERVGSPHAETVRPVLERVREKMGR